MKRGMTYKVLIADSDVIFMARLKNVMRQLVSRVVGLPVKIYEARNKQELRVAFTKKIFLVLIDYLFVLKEHKFLENIFSRNTESRQVLLISHKGGLKIRDLIRQIKKHKHLKFDDYILKDNYSLDFILELIRIFLAPIINKSARNSDP